MTANMIALDCLSRTMSSMEPMWLSARSFTDVPRTVFARMAVVWPMVVCMLLPGAGVIPRSVVTKDSIRTLGARTASVVLLVLTLGAALLILTASLLLFHLTFLLLVLG